MMLSLRSLSQTHAKLAALDRAQAVIEFDLSGKILTANANFLATLGYALSEIQGQHHGMFVDPLYAASDDYRAFWARLRVGEAQATQFQRVAKGGRKIWIEGSYNPVLGRDGKPERIIKFATDITRQKLEDADRAGQIAAIGKSQAVIAFTPDGEILDANDNFLSVLGYRLEDVVGQHHRMFVEPSHAAGEDYKAFWASLKRGTYQAAQYKRIGKGGREVWIQASYNPILDSSGHTYKVVKFATDITDQVKLLASLQTIIDQNFGEIDVAVGRSSGETGAAMDAARTSSSSVQTMAAATEELAASVAEISQSMTSSEGASDEAFNRVNRASDSARQLSDAASAMSGIIGMISTIAAQINLLALNATIEAARAGAAGRGFAVVAQEVKTLATQASRATEQINVEINGVQSISTEVVDALGSIREAVGVMRGNVVSTAAAVEEQSAVTRDLSANMQDTARAVSAISGNMIAISAAIAQVSNAVATTRSAAQTLAR